MNTRHFVKFAAGDSPASIQRRCGSALAKDTDPLLSIIIPTADGYRGGYFPALLAQIEGQSFQDFELITIQGDNRQGRAINVGAALARGRYLMTLDDDTCLGHPDLFRRLVETLEHHPQIGMAGVPNLIPQNATAFVRKVMSQIPRRRSLMVDRITVSDMAEHPCLIMRKDVFFSVGGENELIPRGLDPYLRRLFREAGFQVVVIPEVFIHHLPPPNLPRLMRQFFRNGRLAWYVNRFYPQWVYELTVEHADLKHSQAQVGWDQRIVRQVVGLGKGLVQGKPIFCLAQTSYLAGFAWGILSD
jgi:GT2 family glycosyltransferase